MCTTHWICANKQPGARCWLPQQLHANVRLSRAGVAERAGRARSRAGATLGRGLPPRPIPLPLPRGRDGGVLARLLAVLCSASGACVWVSLLILPRRALFWSRGFGGHLEDRVSANLSVPSRPRQPASDAAVSPEPAKKSYRRRCRRSAVDPRGLLYFGSHCGVAGSVLLRANAGQRPPEPMRQR